tara:strand:+ start:36770 stop:37450 length:681 start_codon:yes stop_codon:yes gene_type:complete
VLILASASKARSFLLEKADISHKSIVSDVDEEDFKSKDVKTLVKLLAFAKAKSVAEKVLKDYLDLDVLNKINGVIGCDSLFEFEGEIFGKPSSEVEALDRLKRMSSSFGYLHTGHTIILGEPSGSRRLFKSKAIVKDVVTTKIYFDEISIDEILNYIDTGEPFECAGGFSIEGKGGRFISKIDGCYSNVIGLSLPWLRKVLLKNGLVEEIKFPEKSSNLLRTFLGI